MRHVPRLVTCALLALVPALAAQPPSGSVVVEKNVEARMRDGVVLRADVYRPRRAGTLPGASRAHAVLEEPRTRRQLLPSPGRAGLRRGRAGHPRALHVRRHRACRTTRPRTATTRSSGWRRCPYVERPRRDVRRQLRRDHATDGRAAASAAPGRDLPVVVVQQPLRHGVSGRRVLSRRRPVVEPRPGADVRRRVLEPAVDRDGAIGLDRRTSAGASRRVAVARAAEDDRRDGAPRTRPATSRC